MNDLTHLSLFTGIGGIDLAAEWAGFRTVGQVERGEYQRRILEHHWSGVPRWENIEDLSADDFKRRTSEECPTLISGGFPCQGFSYAGKREGTKDDRYLWPEMFRVVREFRPPWVLGENVPGITDLALDIVLADLESIGYSCRAFNIPACGVGAWHRRARIFIVAYSMPFGHTDGCEIPGREERSETERGLCEPSGSGDLSNPWNMQRPQFGQDRRMGGIWESSPDGRITWTVEPPVGRVVDGIPSRVDRLTCLGNAVVPQQVYPILKAIAEIEG